MALYERSAMFAFALDPQPERVPPVPKPGRKKATTNLTVHERLVLKAEAIFPGSEIVSHTSYSQK